MWSLPGCWPSLLPELLPRREPRKVACNDRKKASRQRDLPRRPRQGAAASPQSTPAMSIGGAAMRGARDEDPGERENPRIPASTARGVSKDPRTGEWDYVTSAGRIKSNALETYRPFPRTCRSTSSPLAQGKRPLQQDPCA